MNHEVVNPIVLPCLWNIGDHLTTKNMVFLLLVTLYIIPTSLFSITNKPLLASDPGYLQQYFGKSRFDS